MFRKVSPKRISDGIIEQFKELLSSGALKPGDELPSEREMAKLLGVSRPPLREALNALQVMGFIEIQPRKAIKVNTVAHRLLDDPLSLLISESIDNLFELLEIRRAMEGWAAYKAAQRATSEDVRKLESILLQDEENIRNGVEDTKTDADFHLAIAVATGNAIFSHVMASCYHLLWKAQKMARDNLFRKGENRRLIAQQHRNVFEAIRDRDSDKASKEARRHIEFVEAELRTIMSLEH